MMSSNKIIKYPSAVEGKITNLGNLEGTETNANRCGMLSSLVESIVGAQAVIENGGKVEIVPLREGFSTTNIIGQMKKI